MKHYGLLDIDDETIIKKKYNPGKFVSNDNLEYEVLVEI